MKVHPVARLLALTLLATAYAALAMCIAGTDVAGVLPPLSRAMTFVVPLAAGLLVSCAVAKPHVVTAAFVAVLTIALAGAVAVTAGWLPLDWFVFSGMALAGASLAGGVAGALTSSQRLRAGVAVIVALAPPVVVRYEAAVPTANTPVTITSAASVHAPVIEAWQQLIEEDGPLAAARATEWDDDEHLQVVAVRHPMVAPRGLAAWHRGLGESSIISTGATYELASSGDSTATFNISRTWRMAVHANAYPASWLTDVATARAAAERGTLVARSEARAQSAEPWLTADMRLLRAAAIADLRDVFARRGEIAGTSVLFINGARAVELPEDIPTPERRDEPRAIAALRTALRPAADRARTTAWMFTAFGAPAAAASPLGDSLRMEFEDYQGRCIAEVSPIGYSRNNSAIEVGKARRARCAQIVMAERTRRSRLLAQLPLSAGKLEDSWSIALAVTGRAQVYADSVVLRADTLRLKAKPLDGAAQAVDSIAAGLSLGGNGSWSIVKRGVAMRLDTTFAAQQEWTRTRVRFSIPVDSEFPLGRSWPSFEVILRVPKTADNPYGVAWTYAHAPMAYFNGVRYP